MVDVAGLLTQLSQALQKVPTAEVGCQTTESFGNSVLSCYDFTVNEIIFHLKDRKRRGDFQSPDPAIHGKKIRLTPQQTPTPEKKLSLMHPPSGSISTIHTEDYPLFTDNISEPFDENDRSPDKEYPTPPRGIPSPPKKNDHYDCTCPKCGVIAEGYTTIMDVFGWKYDRRNRQVPQSWCKSCRHLSSKPALSEVEHSDRCFDEDTSVINRRGSIFVISSHGQNGMQFHDTIKKANETWKEAEERHKAKLHPIVEKRLKFMQIIATQEKKSMDSTLKKYGSLTCLELFCRIKNESPALLKPLGLREPV